MTTLASDTVISENFTVENDEFTLDGVHFPRYSTSSQIAKWAGVDQRWVQRQVRRGVASPVLFKVERQFDRAGTLRLLLLARLQARFGESSSLPFELVEAAGPAIDFLLGNPSAGTILALRDGNPLHLVIGVPGLRELLAGAA